MSSRILLIEDEPGLQLALKDLLAGEQYEVVIEGQGEAGLNRASNETFDLIILDVMLPEKTGFAVCSELRRKGIDTPVLMLTAKTQVVDRVVGLKLGADDYLTKPFNPAELLARIEALLRRTNKADRVSVRTFDFDDVQIDFDRAEVYRAGRPVSMAAKELQLLRYLVNHRDRVVPREEILQKVWEYDQDVSSRTIDVHVAWLRQKLDQPENPKHIQTVRGKGYRFTA